VEGLKDGGIEESFVSYIVTEPCRPCKFCLKTILQAKFDLIFSAFFDVHHLHQLGSEAKEEMTSSLLAKNLVSTNKFVIVTCYSSSHLIFTFSITSLGDQGNGHIRKETEVKLLGVKGLKEDSREKDFVSVNKVVIITLYSISHLTLTFSINSLCY
jgi:hypothetical protein